MAYTKQTWNNGDIITADKMNHMEDGIASSDAMIVRSVDDDGTFIIYDKTWQEVTNALKNGMPVYILEETEGIEEQNIPEVTYFKPIIGSEIATTGSLPYKIYFITNLSTSIGRL